MYLGIFLLVKKSLKSVTCMAFGYAFLLMVMSEVLPVTAPLMLTVAFFVPFMDRRSFLTLILIQSAYATLMTLIYRDALRAAFLGIDILHLAATTVLLITHLLAAIGIHVPQIAIQIGTIILVTLLLWRLGNAVSKVVLYALIFLLISLFAGLIPTIAQYLIPNPPQT